MLDEVFIERLAAAVAAKMPRPTGVRWPELMSIKVAAEYMGRPEGGIRHLIATKVLPTCRIDRRTQIRRVDIDRVIERHTG
jgi:hypothetical protein